MKFISRKWDSQFHSFPDSSNVERIWDFIKHVYVDRRYTGERSFDKPPRVKMGEAEDSYENRRDAYQAGSQSPPYEDTYEVMNVVIAKDLVLVEEVKIGIIKILVTKEEVLDMIKKVCGESSPSSFQCKSTGVGPFGFVSSSICSGSNCWNTCGFTCKQLNNFPPASAQAGAPVGHMTVSLFGVGAPAAATTNKLTTFPSGGAPAAAPGSATVFPSNGGQ
ncbi:hypothetical protein Acr_02g0004530 [Actinidia rufa]|uniref:Uncharacterized protein n=1 Tax=Actinidia rufa TaxID=165716 RepID=A0A7J0E6T7_9ERIC|nr:hypothetical protein Acr_02g0004530 [Actinidia rufa]